MGNSRFKQAIDFRISAPPRNSYLHYSSSMLEWLMIPQCAHPVLTIIIVLTSTVVGGQGGGIVTRGKKRTGRGREV